MTLAVQPTTKDHAYQCAEVLLASFADDPIFPNFMKGIPHEEQVKFFAESMAKDLNSPETRILEIVDTETGYAIGIFEFRYWFDFEKVDSKRLLQLAKL